VKRFGVILMLIGLIAIAGSCTLFPSQYGSDYAAVNPVGVLGGIFGALLGLGGLGFMFGADHSGR
jgi:membrane associated rhomboid family serine protease